MRMRAGSLLMVVTRGAESTLTLFFTESARSIALLDVYSRVSRLLEALAVSGPNGQRDIPRRLTHQAIANQVGASREMVSKILKELEKAGFVQTGGQRIALLKPLPKTW